MRMFPPMDFGLTPQQRLILRRARARGLKGVERSQVLPPLWAVALLTLVLLYPSRGLALFIPLLTYWHRQRTEMRIEEWALDLREL